MDLWGRPLSFWVLISMMLGNGLIGVIWTLSVGKQARRYDGWIRRPVSWRWWATIREAGLAAMFILIALFAISGFYDRWLYIAVLGALFVAKIGVFRKWRGLPFPLTESDTGGGYDDARQRSDPLRPAGQGSGGDRIL